MTEAQNMEKILKALKVVVMDVTKNMEQLEEEFNDLKSQIKNQDGEIQAISKMFNQAFEHIEGGTGVMPTSETSSIVDDEKLRALEVSLDVTKNRIDQLQTKFTELETSSQTFPTGTFITHHHPMWSPQGFIRGRFIFKW